MTTQKERTPVRVVPHFSRLQEWIALDEGFFQEEGLEPEMLQEVLQAYFRALKRADEVLAHDPERYLPLCERNVPPGLSGEYDYATFGLGEKFVFEPYTEEMFQQALHFAERWNLHTHVREDRYDRLILPASI